MTRPFPLALLGAIVAALGLAAASPANAHSDDERSRSVRLHRGPAAGANVERASCTDEKGVRICRAAAAEISEADAPIAAEAAPVAIIDRTVTIYVERVLPRRLRTQGFTTGKVYRSKRYTQGFYADRIAAGL